MRLKVNDVCQLLDKSKFPATHTQLGCTFTNNGDGSFTINGTIQNGGSWSHPLQQITQNLYGHKILLLTNSTSDIVRGEMKFTLQNGSSKWGTYNSIYTVIYDDYKYIVIRIYMDNVDAGKTIDNATVKFQLFDLTEMYGAGHEPTTVEQFRQDFPNEMYEYSPVCWKKFRRLKYVTETKNLFDISKVVETVYVKRSGDGLICSLYGTPIGKLGTICPSLKVGDTVTVSFKTVSAGVAGNFIQTDNHILRNGEKFTVSETGLTSQFYLYNTSYEYRDIPNKTTYYELQLELGSTATPYQPYGYLPLNRGKYIANKEPVQLLDKSKYPATGTSNGITYTKNEDGSYNVNGTVANTGLSALLIGTAEMVVGHIYLNNSAPVRGQKSYVECKFWIRDLQRWVFPGSRFQCGNYSAYAQITLLVNQTAGTVISDEKLCPELFDLTEMYGAGNEPTAEEFWATHPKTTMYDYNPYNAITFR